MNNSLTVSRDVIKEKDFTGKYAEKSYFSFTFTLCDSDKQDK